MGKIKKMELDCPQQCPVTGQLCSEHKLKDRKVHLNIRKQWFTVWGFEHRKRFSREVVEFPSLEIPKTQLHTVLSNLF